MNHILLVAIATLLLAASPFRAVAQPGNAANGESMYRACAPCHSLEPDRNMTGPSLAELWNRKSGGLPSFPRYSPALKSAGIIWNDDTLNEWIKDPQHFIPGNAMTFPEHKGAATTGRSARVSKGYKQARPRTESRARWRSNGRHDDGWRPGS
jgi:cytochrome c